MKNSYQSEAFGAIHETASDLHDAGIMDKRAMRKFDELCLTPVCSLKLRPKGWAR